MRILASEVVSHAGQDVVVSGWVHRIRDLGKVCFVLLRDRSGILQIVFDTKPEVTPESVIRVTGTAAVNPKAPGGAEVRARTLETLSEASPDLPIPVNQEPDCGFDGSDEAGRIGVPYGKPFRIGCRLREDTAEFRLTGFCRSIGLFALTASKFFLSHRHACPVVADIEDRNGLVRLPRFILLQNLLVLLAGPEFHLLADPFGHPFDLLGVDLQPGINPQIVVTFLERGLTSSSGYHSAYPRGTRGFNDVQFLVPGIPCGLTTGASKHRAAVGHGPENRQ